MIYFPGRSKKPSLSGLKLENDKTEVTLSEIIDPDHEKTMATANMKISRRCLADYMKKLHQNACHMCTIIHFPYSINQIIDF